ncbi:cyanophycinase [Candidatus Cyanaurora vandensis]|uniref:cyanophycinase n=1 Tax=Candidatus Cyanaurora vandensis TaxID=2714958 RepID=UPI00257E3FF7|nr:cyanophycinase [Candidatus Cyanaurora vandensis]
MQRLLALGILTALLNPVQAAGVLVVAGGGSEGDIGDTQSWSYRLYQPLVSNGDVNGDGQVQVVILSTKAETSFLPNYFVWLGADTAVNLQVTNRTAANNATLVAPLQQADVVFIKGGDQGVYYDTWNDTLLENYLLAVDQRGGAIGGTSAGAMSLAQYCFAGGKDYISLDVLTDSQTAYLNDSDGGSGIHTDFLSLIPGVVLDTHYTERGRLGRTVGLLGKASQDYNLSGLLAVGVSEKTGLVITGNTAEVLGVGGVDFIQPTGNTTLRRDVGHPLYYTHLRLDRLTEGWRYDLSTRTPDTLNRPSSSLRVSYSGDSTANSGSLTLRGNRTGDQEQFTRTVAYSPQSYQTQLGILSPYLKNTLGLVDAQNSNNRGSIQESLYRALYDYPSYTGFLVAAPGQLRRTTSQADGLRFERNNPQAAPEAATLVLDGKTLTHRGLAPYPAVLDTGSDTLQAAALINLRLHVLAETNRQSTGYNTRTHRLITN